MKIGKWINDRSLEGLWPGEYASIWDRSDNSELTDFKWTGNYVEDYINLATQYKDAGYAVLNEVIQSENNHIKTDTWFLAGVFMLRQSIELMLKAKVYKAFPDKRRVQQVLVEERHDLSGLLDCIVNAESNVSFPEQDLEWLKKYIFEIEMFDKKSNLFRYPFEVAFLKKYSETSLDIREVGNRMLVAFDIISEFLLHDCEVQSNSHNLELTPEFFVTAGNGVDGCRIGWGSYNRSCDENYYDVIEGYEDVSEFLIYMERNSEEMFFPFPILFSLRHLIELELKQLASSEFQEIKNLRIRLKSHRLRPKLWMKIRPVVEKIGNSSAASSPLDSVDYLVSEFDKLDRKGDFFRYPAEFNHGSHNLPEPMDLLQVQRCVRSVTNFFEGCDGAFSSAAENQKSHYFL